MAFLVSEEFKGRLPVDFYTFDRNKYGPFCIDIYNDTDMLQYWEFIQRKPGVERNHESYFISGQIDLDELKLAEDIKHFIKETVSWVADMSFSKLVRAIYLRFPEYLERSIFPFDKEQAIHESFERSLKQLQEGQTTLASDIIDELRMAARENE